MRLGEAVVGLLAEHYGVDTVFGIPGVHNIELYRGLHRFGVLHGGSIPRLHAGRTTKGLTTSRTDVSTNAHTMHPYLANCLRT